MSNRHAAARKRLDRFSSWSFVALFFSFFGVVFAARDLPDMQGAALGMALAVAFGCCIWRERVLKREIAKEGDAIRKELLEEKAKTTPQTD